MTIFFIVLFVCLFLSIPVALSLALPSMILLFQQGTPFSIVGQKLFGSLDSTALLAIPFFILAGNMMSTGGISKRLVNFCNTLVGKSYGGLATVTIVACMFFAAVSGSGVATCAAIGGIMIGAMEKEGYNKAWAAGTTAAAAQIGVIIPPSIPMVLYGVAVNVSISDLFLAGFLPGILIGISLILVAKLFSKKHNYYGGKKSTAKEKLIALKNAFWAILMPVIILGGIYGGIFTPTEAAIVAAVYAFVVGALIHRELKIKDVIKAFHDSAITLGSIMLILSAAGLFAYVMTINQVPAIVSNLVINMTDNKYVYLLLVNLLLFVVGMFFDTAPAIIVLSPILLPAAVALGVDPVHFGIIMVCNLAAGMVTPPFGVTLFAAAQIAKINYEQMLRYVIVYIGILFMDVMLITYIPAISLLLPNLFRS